MRNLKDVDDPGDSGAGGGGATGGGAGGTLFTRKTLTITWAFPSNAPNPDGFEVVAFLGSDPSDTTTYLFPPVNVLGTDREFVRTFFPKTNLANINAAVRAVYA